MALTVTCSLGTVSGPVTVEAEENAARVATCTIYSSAEADTFVGQAVTIAYGSTIFSGKVNAATANTDMDQVTLQCSDLLQNVMEAKTEAELLALIPAGLYSSHVFGDREDGWQQCMDILSTWPGSVHLNNSGTPVVQAWSGAPGTVPTHVVGTAQEDSLALRDITNRVKITFQTRFTRRHHREHTFGWNWGVGSFCNWLTNVNHTLPLREMIQSAAEGAVWKIQNNYISYTGLPESQVYICSGSTLPWILPERLAESHAIAAGWTAVRRWSQTVTRTNIVTVQSAGSVAAHGEQLKEDGVTYVEEYSDDAWDQDNGTDTPVDGGWYVDDIGDYVSDEITEEDAAAAIECKIAQAATRIIQTHRRAAVGYTIPCDPAIDLDGSVMQFAHSIDAAAGRATTTVRKSKDGAGTMPVIAAPDAQDTAPTHGAPVSHTELLTRIGQQDGAPEYDENWMGYTGNTRPPLVGEVYPDRFRVVTPDIEDAARDEVAPEADESTVEVSL